MNQDVLQFKRGNSIEMTVVFDVLDDYGISALSGVSAVCQIRPRHGSAPVAEMDVTVYPGQSRLLLAMPSEKAELLKEGRYVLDIEFTRLSDGLKQSSGDFYIDIIKRTSHAD